MAKVIGTWPNNSTQPKLIYLGNYRYELDIAPDIKPSIHFLVLTLQQTFVW